MACRLQYLICFSSVKKKKNINKGFTKILKYVSKYCKYCVRNLLRIHSIYTIFIVLWQLIFLYLYTIMYIEQHKYVTDEFCNCWKTAEQRLIK